PCTGLPSQVMAPSVGLRKPAIALSSVVLPQPLGPTSVTNSPAPIARSTSPVACTGPSAVSKKCRNPVTTILSRVGGLSVIAGALPREFGSVSRTSGAKRSAEPGPRFFGGDAVSQKPGPRLCAASRLVRGTVGTACAFALCARPQCSLPLQSASFVGSGGRSLK